MVHAGILNQRDNLEHQQQCSRYNIKDIDLVAVNLYAFEKTVTRRDCSLADAIENIDIGGPTLIRAAAKNFQDVTVVVDPGDYRLILDEIKQSGNTTLKTRFYLAAKVFALTSQYDTAISQWLDTIDPATNTYFTGE
jgi:phosphoribosylaminoimidazolecarboxamide formyltransferase/IMP cyclohydrolase